MARPRLRFAAHKPRDDAEFRLHAAVVQHLRLAAQAGVFFFHPANGEARSARTGARLKRMGTRPGVPDLVLIIEGYVYGLELKARGGRLSAAQQIAKTDWERAGGEYAVADGIDSALGILVCWGALPMGYAPTRRQQLPLGLAGRAA